MAENSRDNQKGVNTKHSKKCFRLIVIIIIAVFFGPLFLFIRQYNNVDKQLAAIEAAHAIPDVENAAILYNQLLNKYDKSTFSSLSIDPNDIANKKPWLTKDYPGLAKWFEERHEIVTNLLQFNKFEKCRFSIPSLPDGISITVNRIQIMRQWAYFLARSANNDIAEGRIEKALEKYFCIIRMGRHSFQQPVALDILSGIALESMALQRLRICAIETDLTEEQIQTIEKALKQTDNEWTREWNNMIEVERLYNKQSPLWDRLKSWWQNLQGNKSTFDRMNEINQRFLADRQGTEIIIALRRYKNENGHWPESLDSIKSYAPAEAFIDPVTGNPLQYENHGERFSLYGETANIWPK